MPIDRSTVPVFVLCGGLGTRLREETEFRPKPMVPVGSRPILWHIMSEYSGYGFKKFVLCLGYKAEVIKDYFLNYKALNCDFTLDLHGNNLTVHNSHEQDWNVTLVDTGKKAMTGARVAKAAKKYLGDAAHFAVTYGDGLTDVDLAQELEFHQKHQRLGTVLAVNPPSRFGELRLDGDKCLEFAEKPDFVDNYINGGYFFFRRGFLNYVSEADECVLEQEPLVRLARDGQLTAYKHRGFWACMDTQRDREYLDKIWNTGSAPWRPGKHKEV
jgi:glucose-1-phosphate cytidylyltransferase